MKAIIIAGGRGERLRPLTNHIPKSMLKVSGKPVLEHIITSFKKNGIYNFIFALGYLSEVIYNHFGDGKKHGVTIEYSYEDPIEPLGTAGAILPFRKSLNESFIVTYGDILRDLAITEMIDFHKKNKAIASINVYKRRGKNPKSKILFTPSGRIKKFIERPQLSTFEDFIWSNGSFYIFEPEIFDYITKPPPVDFGRDVFPEVIRKKKPLFAYKSDDYFIDIGTKEKFREAKEKYAG